jgi:hypothetical protein
MSRQRFPYTSHPTFPVGIPSITIQLRHETTTIPVSAIVDSGASLNILPYDIGLALNLDWHKQTYPLELEGMLRGVRAYGVLLQAEIAPFPPCRLAFAWLEKPSQQVRVLLGQVNFFQEFDVHFYGSQRWFELALKTG